MSFPAPHRARLHDANPLERHGGEIERRIEDVGIFPEKMPTSASSGRTCSHRTTNGRPALPLHDHGAQVRRSGTIAAVGDDRNDPGLPTMAARVRPFLSACPPTDVTTPPHGDAIFRADLDPVDGAVSLQCSPNPSHLTFQSPPPNHPLARESR